MISGVAGSAAERRGSHQRRARSGSRRGRGTAAALPDQNAHPIGGFNVGELDVRPRLKHHVVCEGGTQAPESLHRRGKLSDHDTLRVADAQDRGLEGFTAGHEPHLPLAGRQTHRGSKQWASVRPADPPQPFAAGSGVYRHLRPGSSLVTQQQRSQSAKPVTGYLRTAAIGIQQRHRGAVRGPRIQNQPVGPDAAVPVAQFLGQPRERLAAHRAPVDVKKVVAVGVALRECDHRLRQNASRCQPKRRTSGRGRVLNVPTKSRLYIAPFQPPCSRDFTGNRSGTIRT